jgi:YD repeat-containing protein
MKTNRLFLFVFILLNTSIFAQKTKPNVMQENLKGGVKSMQYKTYEAEIRDGKTELKNPDQIGLDVLSLYNNKGYLIEEKQFIDARDGNRISTTTYKRDSKNLIIEETYSGRSDKYKYVLLKNNRHEIRINYADGTERIYSFDGNGNKISETSHKGKKTYYTMTYQYDRFGRNTKTTYVNEYYDIYEYDNKNNRTKWTRYKPDGKLIFINKINYTKYDSKGNWLESVDYDITDPNFEKPLIITKREIKYL